MRKSICIFACAIIFMILAASAPSHERTSLFIGDAEWSDDSLMPFIETSNAKLVPAIVFAEFEGITVESSDTLGSLLISRGDRFISYNLNLGSYIDESGNITNADIYSYGGALYLEPEAVCKKLGLKFEVAFAKDGYLAARITNGEEKLSFEELLSIHANSGEVTVPYLYNPTGKTVAGLFMYPYVLSPTPDNINSILPLLGKHKVTFAILPQNIADYAHLLPKIYAAGHAIAYYMNWTGVTNPDTFKADMESANEFLFAFIGKTSRIYVSTETYGYMPKLTGFFAKSCRVSLSGNDLKNDTAVNMALINSPASARYNFSLGADYATRVNYTAFFRKFDGFTELKTMIANEATSNN